MEKCQALHSSQSQAPRSHGNCDQKLTCSGKHRCQGFPSFSSNSSRILGSVFHSSSIQHKYFSDFGHSSRFENVVILSKRRSGQRPGPWALSSRRSRSHIPLVSPSDTVVDDDSYSTNLEDTNVWHRLADQAKKVQALLWNAPGYFETVHWPTFNSITQTLFTTLIVVALFIIVLSSVDRLCARVLAQWVRRGN